MATKKKVSFGKENAEESQEIVKAAESVVATAADVEAPQFGIAGDVDESDIIRPSLKLVHGVGDLAEHFDPGELVFNKEVALERPVQLSFLAGKKEWVENVEYGGDQIARIFQNEREAHAEGLTTQWGADSTPPDCFPRLTTVVAIESETEHPGFMFEYDGKYIALAEFIMQKSAYNRAGKLVMTAAQHTYAKRGGLPRGLWSLDTAKTKAGKNVIQVPVLRGVGQNSDEKVEFLKSLI